MSRPLERPVLSRHAVRRYDAQRDQHVLVGPEAVLVLDSTAAAIVELCDGRTVSEMCAALARRFEGFDEGEARAFLRTLARKKWVRDADA